MGEAVAREEDDMAISDDEQARARSVFAAEQGEIWVAKKRSELDALPKGTVVVIDIATGKYVTGKTWLQAHPAFAQRFGPSALGYIYRVGERSFIGGGIG